MPFRTKNTVSNSQGTVNIRKKTYTGRGRAPAGTRKVRPVTVRTAPTVTTSRGKVTTSGFESEAAAQKATQRTRSARVRVRRIERQVAGKEQHRLERAALKTLRQGPPPPMVAIVAASQGVKPPQSPEWRKAFPDAAKAADKAYVEHIAKHEGLKEDPLAELAIDTVATAGLGAAARGAGALGKAGVEELAAKLASKTTTAGVEAAETGIKSIAKSAAKGAEKRVAAKAERVKTAPARAIEGVKAAPRRVRGIPGEAKRAATTAEGRRAAARGAARTAARHPVRTGVPAAAISPVPLPGELDKRARALLKGTAAVVVQHPGQVAETTGRAGIGLITAPLAVIGAGVESAKRGSLTPLEQTGGELGKGIVHIAEELASGNAQKIEETTLRESGLIPFLPAPAILRRLKGTSAYEDAIRGALRDYVEAKRGKTRAGRVAAEKAAHESGRFRKVKRIRQPVADTARPGESYVLRRTGKLIEKSRSRRGISREVARMQKFGEGWGSAEAESIVKELRKSKLIHRGEKGENVSDAMRLAAKFGLHPDAQTGTAAVRQLLETYGKAKHGDVPSGVYLDRHAARWIIDHPAVWSDKHFWAAVDIFKRGAEKVGTSERNRWLASAVAHVNPRRKAEGLAPIRTPEERIPAATEEILRRAVPKRSEPWTRSEALSYAEDLKGITKGREGVIAKARRKKLLTSMRGLMKPPEHGGAEKGIATTRARAYTDTMLADFTRQMRAEHRRLGLKEPAAYVADVVPAGAKGAEKTPNYAGNIQPRKVWPSRGEAAKSGNAEAGFESFLRHSVYAPRSLRAVSQGLSRVLDRYSRTVLGKRYLTAREMERAINTHQVPEDTVWLRTQFVKGALTGDHPLSPEDFTALFKGEVEHGQRLASSSGAELRSELLAGEHLKGEKFAPVDGAAARELVAQMERSPLAGFAKVGNATTRLILNSPAFEAVQFAQEGLPMLAAMGKALPELPRAFLTVARSRELDPELQAQIKAVVGSSAGLKGAPKMAELKAAGVLDPIRSAAPPSVWQHFWEVVNGTKLGKFDLARGGGFREVAAAAKLERDFKAWSKGAHNLFHDQEKAIEAMKGMTREQRLAYVAGHPKLGERLMRAMNDLAGNWNSYTAFEKRWAPALIFYSFQRFSVLWTLFHYPLNHPVAATALGLAAEVNARELEEVAASEGAKITNPLQFSFPVVKTAPGPVSKDNTFVLPLGPRTSPALSSPVEAALESKPSRLLGSLSPPLQITLSALQGVDSYTGEKLDESGFIYAARSIVALSPAARYLKLHELGETKSPIAKAFQRLNSKRTERSVINPYLSQAGGQFATEAKLAEALKVASENGSTALKDKATKLSAEGKVLSTPDRKRMEARADEAQKAIDQILKRLGLAAEDQRDYELWKASVYGEKPKLRKVRRIGSGIGGRSVGSASGSVGGSRGSGVGGYSLGGGGIGGGPVGAPSGGGIGGHPLR